MKPTATPQDNKRREPKPTCSKRKDVEIREDGSGIVRYCVFSKSHLGSCSWRIDEG
jgi:hypothetical protein